MLSVGPDFTFGGQTVWSYAGRGAADLRATLGWQEVEEFEDGKEDRMTRTIEGDTMYVVDPPTHLLVTAVRKWYWEGACKTLGRVLSLVVKVATAVKIPR